MQRVLVTGAGGYIGRHVTSALEGRAEVLTLHDPGQVERIDLLAPGAASSAINTLRPDILIHLAWVTDHGKFWTSPLNETWEQASIALFKMFFAAGGQRAIGIGTCAEYDWTGATACLSEDAPIAPHTPYGRCKARTAEALLDLAQRDGVSAAWGRVFHTFGLGEPPNRLIPAMIGACHDRQSLDCGPADTARDFWHVRHLGAAIAALALSSTTGAVNLASGRLACFAEIGNLIETAAGTRGCLRFGRRMLGDGEPSLLGADTRRLRTEVGFPETGDLAAELKDYLADLALRQAHRPKL